MQLVYLSIVIQNQIKTFKLYYIGIQYMKYRNQPQIITDVLNITSESGQEGINITSLLSKSNLTHTRLSTIITNLTGVGLLNKIECDGKNTFIITPKGKLYLEEYKKYQNIVTSFGLDM